MSVLKPTLRDNFGKYQKEATVRISKQLKDTAKDLEVNVQNIIAEKLLETYKNNVLLSYGPRSQRGEEIQKYNKSQKAKEQEDKEKYGIDSRRHRKKQTYHHTNTFENSIGVKIEDNKIKIVIQDNMYDNGKTASEVYEYLTKGTQGGGYYTFKGDDGKIKWAYNYPTPAHLFEEHTKLQMQGFLDSLDLNDYVNTKKRR